VERSWRLLPLLRIVHLREQKGEGKILKGTFAERILKAQSSKTEETGEDISNAITWGGTRKRSKLEAEMGNCGYRRVRGMKGPLTSWQKEKEKKKTA